MNAFHTLVAFGRDRGGGDEGKGNRGGGVKEQPFLSGGKGLAQV